MSKDKFKALKAGCTGEQDYILSAEFYITVTKHEIKHPRWWQVFKKAELAIVEGSEWVKMSLPICNEEYMSVMNGDNLTINGLMVLKAMANVGTFNIRNVSVENINNIKTNYIKTDKYYFEGDCDE